MIEYVKPAEESMDQRPQNAVIDFPAQQRRQHGSYAAEDTASTTPAALFRFFRHAFMPLLTPAPSAGEGKIIFQRYICLTAEIFA
jgi:hypothetical protein